MAPLNKKDLNKGKAAAIAKPPNAAAGKVTAVAKRPNAAAGKATVVAKRPNAAAGKVAAVAKRPNAGKAVAKPLKPLKGVAGAGFHDFKNGIMMNDGGGNLDDRNDWLESIASKSGNHIAAYYLTVPYKEWVYNFQHDCTMNPDFMSWLFSEFVPREEARERLYPYELVQPGLTRRDMLNGIKYRGVKYLNKDQREKKRINVSNNGLLVDPEGRRYHSGTEFSMNSGHGWAIFVMDKNDAIYVGSHIPGEFHHSSFLGGDYVSSAGEIKVDNGKLVAITCKSGHYRPKKENMKYFLKSLRRRGVNLKGVGVQMGWDDTRLNSLRKRVPLLYDAAEILNGRNVIFYGVI